MSVIANVVLHNSMSQEKIEETKELITSRKWKDMQYNI